MALNIDGDICRVFRYTAGFPELPVSYEHAKTMISYWQRLRTTGEYSPSCRFYSGFYVGQHGSTFAQAGALSIQPQNIGVNILGLPGSNGHELTKSLIRAHTLTKLGKDFE